MPETKELIDLLITLQEKDTALYSLKKQLADNPVKIEAIKNEQAQFRAEAEEEKKTFLDMQKLRKEKELDLAAREEKIKKSNLELNSIKSNEAYKALLTEIDTAKKEKNTFEDEILELMDKIDKEAIRAKAVEKELKEKDAAAQAKISQVEEDSKRIQTEVDKLTAERDEFAKKVPVDILAKYDFIRESRDGIAIVSLEGENCGGCQTVLRPQTINEVIKGKDFVICDTCSRIIFKKHGT